jgi:hypothetical protein
VLTTTEHKVSALTNAELNNHKGQHLLHAAVLGRGFQTVFREGVSGVLSNSDENLGIL